VPAAPSEKSGFVNFLKIPMQQNLSPSTIIKADEKGFNDWKHITTGSDLDNIRNSSYYKEVVKKHSFLVYRF
jgi:hypothetical protein